ncbi:MAG: Ig-like domain-containing protein [Gemmatimonadaceae bacterium]
MFALHGTAVLSVAPRPPGVQAVAGGCYDFRIGAWDKEAGAVAKVPEPFRLDGTLGSDGVECGQRVARPASGATRRYASAYWSASRDSVHIAWTDGGAGIVMHLAVSGDTLRGVAVALAEGKSGPALARSDVIAWRIACPPTARDSAYARALAASSPGLRALRLEIPSVSLQVGDSMFAHAEGVSGDGQAMRPRVAWRSSDTTVASIDDAGVVRARSGGTATLTVAAGDSRATRRVDVTPRTFTALAVASLGACGLAASGNVYCWGTDPVSGERNPAPSRLASPSRFVFVTAGLNHYCALDAGGHAYCWGDNGAGQLGTGTTTPSQVPVAVAGGLRFSSLTASGLLTCGVAIGGAAQCWGSNTFGRLGAARAPATTCTELRSPCAMTPVPAAEGLAFRTLSAGGLRVCGITLNGEAYCWGSAAPDSTAPPARVKGNFRFIAISAGGDQACAIATDRRAYCWGDNQFGAMGDGTRRSSPTPMPVEGSLRFESIEANAWSTCGLASGRVYCWGADAGGALGRERPAPERCTVSEGATFACSTRPLEIDGGFLAARITRAPRSSPCLITLAGIAHCWGDDVGVRANARACSQRAPLPVGGGGTLREP